jgi:Uri superfamily endonuclease
VLVMRLPRPLRLTVGRLGVYDIDSGWYLYVGSAQGPGGLRARVGRHLRNVERRHWHIDFLREVAPVEDVWLCAGPPSECQWAQALMTAGLRIPIAGFGASDCRCPSHLFYSLRQPNLTILGDTASGTELIGVDA